MATTRIAPLCSTAISTLPSRHSTPRVAMIGSQWAALDTLAPAVPRMVLTQERSAGAPIVPSPSRVGRCARHEQGATYTHQDVRMCSA